MRKHHGSDFWRLDYFMALVRAYPKDILTLSFDQCRVGLVSPEGYPLKKRTMLWTNSPEMAKLLADLFCRCITTHGINKGTIRGQNRITLAQVRPENMCQRIIRGILATSRPSRTNPSSERNCVKTNLGKKTCFICLGDISCEYTSVGNNSRWRNH